MNEPRSSAPNTRDSTPVACSAIAELTPDQLIRWEAEQAAWAKIFAEAEQPPPPKPKRNLTRAKGR